MTGASEPVGRAIVLALGRAAAKVVAIDGELDDLDGLRRASPGVITTAEMSVRDPTAVRREFKFLTNWFTDADVLIHCAGVEAAAVTSYEMSLHLSDRQGGDIIIVARVPAESLAVKALAAGLDDRYRGYGIRYLAIAPPIDAFPSPEGLASSVAHALTENR